MTVIEKELADLAARQAAAEPELRVILRQLADQECVWDEKAKELNSLYLGGLFSPRQKAILQRQVREARMAWQQSQVTVVAVLEKWRLEVPDWAVSIKTSFPLRVNVDRLPVVWKKCRDAAANARGRWQTYKELTFVKQLLRQRFSAEEQKRREADRVKRRAIERAKISAHDGRSRELTDAVKKTLPSQPNCPYCGESLGDTPHADHIYPVTKGGHSVAANMVLVCAACNLKKGSMTLRAFIMRYGLDRETIEMRLHELGKDF